MGESKNKSRLDRAAELAEDARRILEADGESAKGVLDAGVAAACAQWYLDECRADSAQKRLIAAAVVTLRTACEERAQEIDGGR